MGTGAGTGAGTNGEVVVLKAAEVGAGGGAGKRGKGIKGADTRKPPVKVPDGKIGRAIFFGGKAAAAFTAARTIREARKQGDKLALLHGALTAAGLLVTAALAARALREAGQEDQSAATAGGPSSAPASGRRALAAGKPGA
jgi:hypothetical protein